MFSRIQKVSKNQEATCHEVESDPALDVSGNQLQSIGSPARGEGIGMANCHYGGQPGCHAAISARMVADASRSGGPRRAGDGLARTVVTGYVLSELEGRRLIGALRSLDRIDQLEQAIAAAVLPNGEPHTALPALAREQRIFLSLWAHLQLERA